MIVLDTDHISVLQHRSPAAEVFQSLRKQRLRVGSTDLKIASIVLIVRATLLSRNLSDFVQIPGLNVENWLPN